MPPGDKRLYPLASCSIGIWSTPDKAKSYLLLLPEKKLFVILLTREFDTQGQQQASPLSVNALLLWIRNHTSCWLRHKNPFVDHTKAPDRDTSVLAFELSWLNIVGIDFQWPLTRDARLVLEASIMSKRVFNNVESVCLHYQPPPKLSKRSQVSTLRQLAASAAPGNGHKQQQEQKDVHAEPVQAPSNSHDGSTLATSGLTAAAISGVTANGYINKLHAAVAASDGLAIQHQSQASISNMSRVSSWTSWASGRSSIEHSPEAATAAGTTASSSGQQQQQSQSLQDSQEQQQQGPLLCDCHEGAGINSVCCLSPTVQQVQQQQRPTPDEEPECSVGSHISPVGILYKAPTLESGIAMLASAAHSRSGSTCSGRETTPAPFQELNFVTAVSAAAASPESCASVSSATPAAVETAHPMLWPLCGMKPPPSITAVSAADHCIAQDAAHDAPAAAATAHDIAVHVTAPVGGETATPDEYSCEGTGGSHGICPRPIKPIRLLLGEGSPAGAATAPCSMPGSPIKASSRPTHQDDLLLEQIQQPLLQLFHERQGTAGQQQPQQRTVSDSQRSSSSRPSRFRAAAAAADRSCPLCNQPLLQPLNVLQQRFHEKQQVLDSRHARFTRSGRARHAASKSRSACSLEQLLQQSQAAATNVSGKADHKLEQQQQTVGTSLAGRAAAAVGELAARCVAAAHSNSKDGAGTGSSRSTAAEEPVNAATAGAASSAAVAKPPVGMIDSCSLGIGNGEVHSYGYGVMASGAFAGAATGAERQQTVDHTQATAATAAAAPAVAAVDDADGTEKSPAGQHSQATMSSVVADAAAETGASELTASIDVVATSNIAAAEVAAGSSEGQGVYTCRTVVITFKDPTLPYQLKKFVNSNVRLLKLYESGLPSWAVFMPSYGLWYRPWLRHVTWLLFVLLSVVSMAMGFYDLYKNVPYFKQAIIAMFSPAASVFEWLEHHTQIRLSILLTYMLGKSQIFVQLIKLLTHTSLQPIIAPILAILRSLGSALASTAETLAWLAQPFVALGRLILLLLHLLWQLVSVVLWSGPMQLLTAIVQGVFAVVQLILLPVRAVLPGAASIRAGWTAAKATGQAAKAAVPVVKGAAATASQAAGSGWSIWGWWWSPLEALELMRISTMRIMKSLQAVVKFFVTMGSTLNQHRLSLMLQLRQHLRGGLRAAAESPAGRAATAVAVKMGQEERVARLQRRLRRSDTLMSVGSELLPADSAMVSTALSLEGELSMGLMDTEFTPVRGVKYAKGDADSDDEVTSNVTVAPASPAELFSSSAGLRYRSTTSGSRYNATPGPSRLAQQLHSAAVDGDVVSQQQGQQQLRSLRGSNGSSRHVTFAMPFSDMLEGSANMYSIPAVLDRSSTRGRWSLDAAAAIHQGQLDPDISGVAAAPLVQGGLPEHLHSMQESQSVLQGSSTTMQLPLEHWIAGHDAHSTEKSLVPELPDARMHNAHAVQLSSSYDAASLGLFDAAMLQHKQPNALTGALPGQGFGADIRPFRACGVASAGHTTSANGHGCDQAAIMGSARKYRRNSWG